jgi:hypothetical protein
MFTIYFAQLGHCSLAGKDFAIFPELLQVITDDFEPETLV